jgi:hypothetical protein
VDVQADDLTDGQLQCFCAEHKAPQVVRAINLRDCEQITSVECLCVFVQLQELDLSGCKSISTESLADLARSRPKLQAPSAKQNGSGSAGFLYDMLSELGRYTDVIKYENEKLENARQSSELQCVQIGGVFRDRAADWRDWTNQSTVYSIAHVACLNAGDKSGEGAAIQNMGLAYGSLSDFQKQLECSKKYLEIAQQTGKCYSQSDRSISTKFNFSLSVR